MRNAFLTASVLLLSLSLSCGKRATSGITASPAPVDEPAHWSTMGKPSTDDYNDDVDADVVIFDPAVVTPDDRMRSDTLPRYNPSHTFTHDLLHTRLDLSFDWSKRRVLGKAQLTLKPWFYATDQLELDAKNFDIHRVAIQGQQAPAPYRYDNEKLTIDLGRMYSRDQSFTVLIDYTAKPDERETYGGSAAISSDKGLYFINPDGSDANKPRQIWTQGETESNSFWFPTIDKPNERCTQEMYITVDDRFKTLSNGLLLSSTKNADGTRTDYWKMDKPHAPYLFMMAIGEFAVVKDKWRNIDLEYYVEPEYQPHARDIFPYTPDMLEYFSNLIGYPYPWPKYSQVVVRDYVSGAMENTTAVIFGQFVQQTRRELLDNHWTNEKIVAHEMFHHWFGDLVTTENWANLTLNEGFANYSEYLWLEHKHGRDEADYHQINENMGYFLSSQGSEHPLIHFGYRNREEMFDAHSYNKGGAILHMLRHHVGDEAFFTALSRYLKTHEYTDVEAHELRLVFEDVTGQDLNWFFNQWFFMAGAPELVINYNYDAPQATMEVTIEQVQEATEEIPHVFDLPLAVDLYDQTGKAKRSFIRMTKRQQTFRFPAAEKPALVNVDAQKTLLARKTDNHTPEEWAFMFKHSPLLTDRHEAYMQLAMQRQQKDLVLDALNDKSRHIRQLGINNVDLQNAAQVERVLQMAQNDPDPSCRAVALVRLGEHGDARHIDVVRKGLEDHQPYSVVSGALQALSVLDSSAANQAALQLQNDDSEVLASVLAKMFAAKPDPKNMPFFNRQIDKADQMAAFGIFNQYSQFITGINDPELTNQATEKLKAISLHTGNSLFRRFAATKALADMRNHFRETGNASKADDLSKIVTEIREKETDPTLKMYYGSF